MPYYLDNAFLLDNSWITVVGCGGTGGFVAEGLCRLFQGRKATIVLVNHDRVEPHNLLRQNFYAEDVGQFKSKALADRLARAYRRPVGYSVYPFREEESRPNGQRYPGLPNYGDSLIIGCADNAAARRAMAETLPGDPRRWLIDAGNDTNWGQVLVGNVAEPVTLEEPPFTGETCHLAPAPTLQRPRPTDGRFDQTPGRGLRCRARPHRPGPDHQPDDGVAGATGGPPHGGGHLPLHGPLPGHGAVNRHTALRHPGGGGAGGALRLRAGDTVPVTNAQQTHSRKETRRGETMSDKKGNATIWQDNHSGRRRHKLMTNELADTIPPLYANDGADDPDAVVARVKLFSPYNGWRWYITEWDPETGLCFGLVEGFETELGYFDLTELSEVTVFGGVPAVERDLYWQPQTLGEIRRESSGMAA